MLRRYADEEAVDQACELLPRCAKIMELLATAVAWVGKTVFTRLVGQAGVTMIGALAGVQVMAKLRQLLTVAERWGAIVAAFAVAALFLLLTVAIWTAPYPVAAPSVVSGAQLDLGHQHDASTAVRDAVDEIQQSGLTTAQIARRYHSKRIEFAGTIDDVEPDKYSQQVDVRVRRANRDVVWASFPRPRFDYLLSMRKGTPLRVTCSFDKLDIEGFASVEACEVDELAPGTTPP